MAGGGEGGEALAGMNGEWVGEQALRGGELWSGGASVGDVGRSLGVASASSRGRARIWADGVAGPGGRRWRVRTKLSRDSRFRQPHTTRSGCVRRAGTRGIRPS